MTQKQSIYILTVLALMTVSCQSGKDDVAKSGNQYYIETALSFFDPYDSDFTYFTWIRDSENIRMAHETFKKIGYKNLVDSFQFFQNPCMLWGYINKPCNEIMDSLLLTYKLDTIESTYYREFWDRRKKENNDEVVFESLTETAAILFRDSLIRYDNRLVNDTLYKLVLMKKVQTDPTDQQAITDFKYLKDIGLHNSANNLLFQTYRYQDINWERDKLVKQLQTDTTNCCPGAWIMDDTK
jgi:hypothetical protein